MCDSKTYLVEVDCGLPELLLGLVEVPHTDLTEVTGMVLVEVGTVVVLTTGHTTTTGVLTVLSDTTVTGGHMTAARWKKEHVSLRLSIWHSGDGVFFFVGVSGRGSSSQLFFIFA
jgi:hypothetical protein